MISQNLLSLPLVSGESINELAVAPPVVVASALHEDSVMPANSSECPILLRPFRVTDAAPMYDAARESIGQLRAWMTWCNSNYQFRDAENFVSQCEAAWERGGHYSFAIVENHTQQFLGSIGLSQLNLTHRCGNVGYWVRDSAAGRGIATAATRLLARFAFQELGLCRLEFLIAAGNMASQRVAQKAGAKFEGLLRNRLRLNGTCHDAALFGLVAGARSGLTVLNMTLPTQCS